MSVLTPTRSAPLGHGFIRCLHLHWCPAVNLKLLQTKGHDKLGVGVSEESHNKLWHKFPMGSQGPVSTRRGRQTEMKDKVAGLGREHVSKICLLLQVGTER
jgi:hypothetical protein